MDGVFSKDNFVTKISMKTCSPLNNSPEETVFAPPFMLGQETLISSTEVFYRHVSKPHLKADRQVLMLQKTILS